MIALKFLERGAVGRFSGFAWPQPSGDRPGGWVEAAAEVRQCFHGVHASRRDGLLDWIDDELWEVELDGRVLETEGMLVAERGRLLRRVEAWDESAAAGFAADCALRARDRAFGALRGLGLTEEADRLVRAVGLGAVEAAAAAAHEAAADADAAELTGFVADTASLATGRRPDAWRQDAARQTGIAQAPAATAANVAFVVAHAAGREAAKTRPHDPRSYETAFNAERAAQIGWLVAAGVIDASDT